MRTKNTKSSSSENPVIFCSIENGHFQFYVVEDTGKNLKELDKGIFEKIKNKTPLSNIEERKLESFLHANSKKRE